ncbi:MAG: DUF3857 domain-containing transglutaminase family protein [Marinifilaceae bacterium]
MKKHISLLCLLVCFCWSHLQAKKNEPVYPVSSIKEQMKKNANSVVRFDQCIFSIESIKRATLKNHKIITILNKKGDHAAIFTTFYDKLMPLLSLKIKIYNANGKLIKKVKNSEIRDFSAASYGTLFSDNRVKLYEPQQKDYPYTIEFEYETQFNGLLNFPGWTPVDRYKQAIEHSELIVKIPLSQELRYKNYNFSGDFSFTENEKEKNFQWLVTDFLALKAEPLSPHFQELAPKVLLGPTDFEMEDYSGNQDSWKGFGQWIATLNKGRCELPQETLSKIKELTADCESTFEKIKVLYEFMQSKTRYVSIQLGIGSWQPFKASTVDEFGYGDCKALSNYMKSLLNAADIPSQYTLVRAGSSAIALDTSFVHNGFNHAILMVPLPKDTVWLECTSQHQPCGFLGSFTQNRNVLVISENGGNIVHTPVYNEHFNIQNRKAEVAIDESGNAEVKVSTHYKGLQYENLNPIYNKGLEDQKKHLYREIKLSDFTIEELLINQNKKRIPESELQMRMSVKAYASQTGDRMFLPLNLMNQSTYIPKKVKERNQKVVIDYPYCDHDTIHITLPNNFQVESLPKPTTIASEFGTYSTQIDIKDDELTFIRSIEIHKGLYPPERYEEVRKFYKSIAKADRTKLVLKKKS